MYTVIGVKRENYNFTDRDGRKVDTTGYRVYCQYDKKDVTGVACTHAYFSDNKLEGYVPAVGDRVEMEYSTNFKRFTSIKLADRKK